MQLQWRKAIVSLQLRHRVRDGLHAVFYRRAHDVGVALQPFGNMLEQTTIATDHCQRGRIAEVPRLLANSNFLHGAGGKFTFCDPFAKRNRTMKLEAASVGKSIDLVK